MIERRGEQSFSHRASLIYLHSEHDHLPFIKDETFHRYHWGDRCLGNRGARIKMILLNCQGASLKYVSMLSANLCGLNSGVFCVQGRFLKRHIAALNQRWIPCRWRQDTLGASDPRVIHYLIDWRWPFSRPSRVHGRQWE